MPLTKESIFTMKKGVDVPDRFDGATIPIMLPANNAEMIELAGENAYIIFNRAYVLEVQKDVKDESNEEGATVESLRTYAKTRKFGEPRVRGAGVKAAPKPAHVQAILGDDFLSTLTPEQRAIYDRKMAEATEKAKAAKAAASNGEKAKTPAAPSTTPAATGKGKGK